jgi:hypothetical protein
MNENIKYGAAAVAVVGLAIGAVVWRDKWWNDEPPPPAAKPVAAVPAEPVAPPPAEPAEPAIKHPVAAPETPPTLPALADSDEPFGKVVEGVMGADNAKRFVFQQNLIRHIVTTVDNLPEQKVVERIRPLHPVPGNFVAAGSEDAPVLDPANYERYAGVVRMVQSLDTKDLVATYTRYYPLFQQSYEGLGHPPEYFNDRLIEVIDHLLETPDVQGPIALARPNVQYEYADPKLEALSAGQKLLIRMGPDNAKGIKDKLRELKTALATTPPPA